MLFRVGLVDWGSLEPWEDAAFITYFLGWQSIQRASDQVPDSAPLADGGALHDGSDIE